MSSKNRKHSAIGIDLNKTVKLKQHATKSTPDKSHNKADWAVLWVGSQTWDTLVNDAARTSKSSRNKTLLKQKTFICSLFLESIDKLKPYLNKYDSRKWK